MYHHEFRKPKLKCFNLCLLALTSSFLVSCNKTTEKSEYQDYREKCLEIELGMTRDEVRLRIGEPKVIRFFAEDSLTEEIWFYTTDPAVSTDIYCRFDSTKGIVIDKLCGE